MASFFFDLNQELQNLAESLDIPPQIAEQAISTYDDVAEWLSQEDSPLREYHPDIYAQGSFRLGTMIKPIEEEGGFDVDLVYRLEIPKERTTQLTSRRELATGSKTVLTFATSLKSAGAAGRGLPTTRF